MLFTAPGAKHFPSRASLVRTVKGAVKKLLSRNGVAGSQGAADSEPRPSEKIKA
jgi:hypothetical protein